MRQQLLGSGAAVAVILGTHLAWADGGPKINDSLWIPVGLNLGYSLNPEPAPNGFLAGPELSFVYLDRDLYWLGAYTDLLRDFGTDTTRLSAGVESGVAIFGMDLGYVAAYHDDWQHGVRARLLITLPVLHLYGGAGRMASGADAYTYGEVGVLLKFPIVVWEDKSSRYHPRPPQPPEPYRLPPRPEPEPAPAPSPFAEPPPE